VSWIFPPGSLLATRAHVYRAESTTPRILAAFAVGVVCSGVFFGLSGQNAAQEAEVKAAAAPATAEASRPTLKPAPKTAATEPATTAGRPHRAETVAKVNETPTVPALVAAAVSTPAAAPPVLDGAAEPVPAAIGTQPDNPPLPQARPTATASRAVAQRRAERRQAADAASMPGFRYLGTRVMPDGTRAPIYQRQRSAYGYADDSGMRRQRSSPFWFFN